MKVMGRALIFALLCAGTAWSLVGVGSQPTKLEVIRFTAAFRDGSKVERAYLRWLDAHEARGGDRAVSIALRWSRAHSVATTPATGLCQLDLLDGRAVVSVRGDDATLGEVWLVDNQDALGSSAAPEPGDRFLALGALSRDGEDLRLEAAVPELTEGFEVDKVVVTRLGEAPTDGAVLVGSPILFQRVYTALRRGALRPRLDELDPGTLSLLETLGPRKAHASAAFSVFGGLVAEGAALFFDETFGGNGRTCGTCHRADNNFTIDARFIAGLPRSDALFVAENNPALAQNFEKPSLMRGLGLILENTNGFSAPATNFTMRSVPHTLGMSQSITAPGGLPTAVGWSADGAPAPGTLREFANGAIRQHAPLTLGRLAGVDFRFATDAELDALEAFQLSLGRQQAALPLAQMIFKSPIVSLGRDAYLNLNNNNGQPAGHCQGCHVNGGANLASGVNANFNTNVEDLPNQPADLIDAANNPADDGLGSPGNGSFNTPSLIEAADTGPFFHNNAVATIEGAVAFYNSDAFNNPRPAFAQIKLQPTEVVAVAALLRVLNALENFRSVRSYGKALSLSSDIGAIRALLTLMLADLEDAIVVLEGGDLHPSAVRVLKKARATLEMIDRGADAATVRLRVRGALRGLTIAEDQIVG